MSITNVSQAIADYLNAEIANGTIPFVTKCYQFPPKFTPEGDLFLEPGINSGGAIWMHFAADGESRVALGGPHDGEKAVEYELELFCLIRTNYQTMDPAGADAFAFRDGLKNAIRAQRNANSPYVFSWGEGAFPTGGRDIEFTSALPVPRTAQVTDWQFHVRVIVIEMNQT